MTILVAYTHPKRSREQESLTAAANPPSQSFRPVVGPLSIRLACHYPYARIAPKF
jgi:hypothetical protein